MTVDEMVALRTWSNAFAAEITPYQDASVTCDFVAFFASPPGRGGLFGAVPLSTGEWEIMRAETETATVVERLSNLGDVLLLADLAAARERNAAFDLPKPPPRRGRHVATSDNKPEPRYPERTSHASGATNGAS